MSTANTNPAETSLETIITSAIQIPGVKVDRKKFLAETFASETDSLESILENGPIAAGMDRDTITRIADKLILNRTAKSSLISFATGIPGGLAMAASIPADVLQFFGMAFRLAQELSYLYGAQDLWQDGEIDSEKVRNQLLLYCGVMFGVSGAAAGVRVLSAQVAKTALKKIPQKALTKTFWYPLLKQIGKAIGVKITKSTVAKGVSKAIPVVGGVISGGLNFASMMPMAKRLEHTLDEACFGYTEEDMEADCMVIENIDENAEPEIEETADKAAEAKEKFAKSVKNAGAGLKGLFGGKGGSHNKNKEEPSGAGSDSDQIFADIEKLAHLREIGAITQDEFTSKKSELLARL